MLVHVNNDIISVADAVKITLGPKGRNVVIGKKFGSPEIINDGVTIARSIELEDQEMNAGAKLVQEVASKSDNSAGDGTTTSTLMTQEIVNQGLRMVAAGANPMSMRVGIMLASSKISKKILDLASPVQGNDDIKNIGSIAANSQEMGSIIANAYELIGEHGSIVVEESKTLNDEVEFSEGLCLDRGYLSPYFVKDHQRQVCEMQAPRVLITDRKITGVHDILPILEHLVKSKESLFIICDDISSEALSALVVNKLRGILDVVAIKAPSFGDRRKAQMQDMAIATGATFISEDLGMSFENIDMSLLGEAETVVVTKDKTTLVTKPHYKEIIAERISDLKAEMIASEAKYDKDKLQQRISSLGGGVGRIKVGAATETELKDKRLRYEDAINSVSSAIEMGVVPGGGATMTYMSSDMELKKSILDGCANEDERLGVEIIYRSLEAPMRQIAENAGYDGAVIADKCRNQSFGYGFNVMNGKYEDFLTTGVLDPAKVTINALTNAASVSAMVLTTEAIVTDIVKESEADNGNDSEYGM